MLIGTMQTELVYTVGFSGSHSESETTTKQNDFKREMSAGIEHDGVSVSKTLSMSHQKKVQKAATDMFTADATLTRTFSCPTSLSHSAKNGVGMYLYVVENSEKTVMSVTAEMICRYGEGYWNKEPECPFSACIDLECKNCEDGWYL